MVSVSNNHRQFFLPLLLLVLVVAKIALTEIISYFFKIQSWSEVVVPTNPYTHLSFPPRSATTPQEGNFRHCWCFSIATPTIFLFKLVGENTNHRQINVKRHTAVCLYRHQQYLFYFFLLSFSLDEKETKNQDKKELQRSRPKLARSRCIGIVSPRSPLFKLITTNYLNPQIICRDV